MEKQRIIRKLTDIANDISLLDIEVTADEIQAEMAKIGGESVGDEDNVEAFDEWDKEVEVEEENEKA